MTNSSIRRTGLRLNSVRTNPERRTAHGARLQRKDARSGDPTPASLSDLYSPDEEPIREGDQAEHEQNGEPVQQAQLDLRVWPTFKVTCPAGVTISFLIGRDGPAFAAFFWHQPDYARCRRGEPPPIRRKSHGTREVFGLSH